MNLARVLNGILLVSCPIQLSYIAIRPSGFHVLLKGKSNAKILPSYCVTIQAVCSIPTRHSPLTVSQFKPYVLFQQDIPLLLCHNSSHMFYSNKTFPSYCVTIQPICSIPTRHSPLTVSRFKPYVLFQQDIPLLLCHHSSHMFYSNKTFPSYCVTIPAVCCIPTKCKLKLVCIRNYLLWILDWF